MSWVRRSKIRPFPSYYAGALSCILLALLAYIPSLSASPGRMPADSKLYLYLNPGRFLSDAATTFDPRQFAGWVPHQHVAYLWPTGPWYWLFDTLGVPDWIAHRLWIGTVMVLAGLGVRLCSRVLGLGSLASLVAAVVYQLSPYVLPYVSRTSVMLLPWAGLGWIVALTIRATRRRTWADPAAIALVVLTVGSVNATALAMIVPGPVLWLLHAAWSRAIRWRVAAVVAMRIGVMSVGVSLWWIVMLLIQGRFGANVLPYSEALVDVSSTALSSEIWRGLGYWLFYIRDPYTATTTASLPYLTSSVAIFISFAVPIACLCGVVFVRWAHRRFAALLIVVGGVVAVGVHPIADQSPLMRIIAGDNESGIALALRSSTRALPLMVLGLALAVGSLVGAFRECRLFSGRFRLDLAVAVTITALAVANLPALYNGGFVDPALLRDQDPPLAWVNAASALDEDRGQGRVLQLPGAEFGAFRWGYTVDQPLPSLTDKPLLTRDLLPLGSPGAMDLLYALDDRIQDGVFETGSIAAIARLLGVDTIWLTNDIAFERFQTARPEVVSDEISRSPGVKAPIEFGRVRVNEPEFQMRDARAIGDPRVGVANAEVQLFELKSPGSIVRVVESSVIVSGNGDGLVDLAAAGLITGNELVRYSGSLDADALVEAISDAAMLLVTDSNRDRAHHWRSSQDTVGFTEPGGPEQGVLRMIASDQRLPVFTSGELLHQTIAIQRGPIVATASSYGEPFAYLPEHRPYMAVDGDPGTAWIVAEHGYPVGEYLHLEISEGIDHLNLLQAPTGGDARYITRITVRADGVNVKSVELDARSLVGEGQRVELPRDFSGGLDITITAVSAPGISNGVGFATISTGLPATIEVVRPPHDLLNLLTPETPFALALTRLRADPMDRWREDPEVQLIREFRLPTSRAVTIEATVRVDPRATDEQLAELFDWPAIATTRLTGSIRSAGISALDGDLGTRWITAFGEANNAILRVLGGTTAVDQIIVRQPIGGFSRITRIAVRANGEQRIVDLETDAVGSSRAAIDPPLAAGNLEVEILEIDRATSVDRRFGDTIELPAAISELEYPGRPDVSPVERSVAQRECAALLSIDDTAIDVSFDTSATDWLDGAPIIARVCAEPQSLKSGTHLLTTLDSALPVQVDRVVFSDGGVSGTIASAAASSVTQSTPRSRQIEVTGCVNGCWLVFGEGYNAAWEASEERGSLGTPTMVDGGFNGWWIDPSAQPVTITVAWTQQRALNLALIASLLVAVGALVLLVRGGRDRQPHEHRRPAQFAFGEDAVNWQRACLTAIFWAGLSALLINPAWAVWGAIAGIAGGAIRRTRVPELVAIASLLTISAAVIYAERRQSPYPGGGWTHTFEVLHGVGLFAMASLLVGAFMTDDGYSDHTGLDGPTRS